MGSSRDAFPMESIRSYLVTPPLTDFDPLLELCIEIQKSGRYPTLTQLEDQLPISVYRGKYVFAFREYVYRAERAKLVAVNRDGSVVALQPPKGKPKSVLGVLSNAMPNVSLSMPSMPSLSLSSMPSMPRVPTVTVPSLSKWMPRVQDWMPSRPTADLVPEFVKTKGYKKIEEEVPFLDGPRRRKRV
jgi:hypothetical protein